ncbi:hypothetical protein BH09BAC2_BH09BAC2_20250 [soil metagenome]
MKVFRLVLLTFLGLFSVAFAQKTVAKIIIQTPTIQCEACKTRVENYMSREDGVQTVKADFRRHTVTISYFKDRTNSENLKTAIANLGFDADDVTAEPESYKRLPITCRHVAAQTAKP